MAETLPFLRGQTAFGGTPDNAHKYDHLLGQEFAFTDDTYGTGRIVWLRAVRNLIAAQKPVSAKSLAILDATGTTIIGVTNIDGSASSTPNALTTPIALVDEKLPSGGCAYQDICYVVVEGYALGVTSLTNVASNVIAVGDYINALTLNTTTGAVTTGGRIKSMVLSSSVTVNAGESSLVFGRAVSSIATSGQTNTGVLIDVFRRL